MLSEAHRRLSRGEDLVVGIVETHGRRAVAALLDGLEQVPRRRIVYRGKVFEEMDTDAVIAREPQFVLVDELAHTNVPGSKHAKRWQDVEEILSTGINVISTLNVQHLESLNDTVFEITGIRVRETLPDSIVDGADEVVLVDLPPEALLNRLKRGDIYDLGKVPQALSGFFRKGNISALRELALRKTADEVDDDLRRYMAEHHIRHTWGAQERVLVLITPSPDSARLIRRGYRLANRMQGELSCVYVRHAGPAADPREEAILSELSDMARNLGAQWEVLEGESVAQEICDYAEKHGVTFIVMGRTTRPRLHELLHGSLITQIMRRLPRVDIVAVGDHADADAST